LRGSAASSASSPTGSILAAQPQVLDRLCRVGFWKKGIFAMVFFLSMDVYDSGNPFSAFM